jgi:hypothetical protein
MISGCSTENSEKPANKTGSTPVETNTKEKVENLASDSPYAKVVQIDSNQDNPTIRAQMGTDNGDLQVVSEGKEMIGHFTIPSVLGQEGDFFYQGNYSVFYNHNDEKKEIRELQSLVFVQPSEKPISFEKIGFESMDVFLLTPEYTASRGYNSYAFGIDKNSGEAFAITFKSGENVHDTMNYEKDNAPLNKSEKLVVTTRNTEGQGDTLTTEYSFDKDSKQFVAQ